MSEEFKPQENQGKHEKGETENTEEQINTNVHIQSNDFLEVPESEASNHASTDFEKLSKAISLEAEHDQAFGETNDVSLEERKLSAQKTANQFLQNLPPELLQLAHLKNKQLRNLINKKK